MGREIRRVPMAFDWPLNKVWEGFLSPFHFPSCPMCRRTTRNPLERYLGPMPEESGDGYTPEARAIAETFYPHQIGGPWADALAWHDKLGQAEVDNLVAEDRLRHWDLEKKAWVRVPRTAEEVNAVNRPGARSGLGGHDAINRHVLVLFRCKQLGIPVECPTCEGMGDIATPDERKAAEDWTGTPPPTGEGYQVWETVSEGSPVSPVFDRAGMVVWLMTRHPGDMHFERGMSREGAERFIEGAWAPSMISGPGTGVISGVEAIDRGVT